MKINNFDVSRLKNDALFNNYGNIVIDLGQAHRDPAGEFGHFGWKEVK